MTPCLSEIELAYQTVIAEMTPVQKFERMLALNSWARFNMARIITAECGPLSDEVLKWRIALRMYGRNPVVRALIEEHLRHVST